MKMILWYLFDLQLIMELQFFVMSFSAPSKVLSPYCSATQDSLCACLSSHSDDVALGSGLLGVYHLGT